MRLAWPGNSRIAQLLTEELSARLSDADRYARDEDVAKHLTKALFDSSGAVLHLTSYGHAGLYSSMWRYRLADSIYLKQGEILDRWSETPFSTAELVSAIPVVGGMLAPIGKKAPTAAAALALLVAVGLTVRALAGAYDSLVVRRIERQLGLLKLQLDVANALISLDVDAAERRRVLVAALSSKFHAMVTSLRRRSARTERLIGHRAFWRWPAERRIQVAKVWLRRLTNNRASTGNRSRKARLVMALGAAAILAGGSMALLSYAYLGLATAEVVDLARHGFDDRAYVGILLAVYAGSLAGLVVAYAAIRWGESVMRAVRKWRRRYRTTNLAKASLAPPA